ncbi:hypothetical protein PG984_010609 [Apiospora sp. TS-2023a]|uniref:Uncharacterized protein n=1 Tax=Apiospora saccharicola TaxID=335842 RepID=A0ABR1VNY3_9PEZI
MTTMSGTYSELEASNLSWGAYLQSCVNALFASPLPHDSDDSSAAPMSEKKYVHVPSQAAAGYLRTTTSHQIRKNNEIL